MSAGLFGGAFGGAFGSTTTSNTIGMLANAPYQQLANQALVIQQPIRIYNPNQKNEEQHPLAWLDRRVNEIRIRL